MGEVRECAIATKVPKQLNVRLLTRCFNGIYFRPEGKWVIAIPDPISVEVTSWSEEFDYRILEVRELKPESTCDVGKRSKVDRATILHHADLIGHRIA